MSASAALRVTGAAPTSRPRPLPAPAHPHTCTTHSAGTGTQHNKPSTRGHYEQPVTIDKGFALTLLANFEAMLSGDNSRRIIAAALRKAFRGAGSSPLSDHEIAIRAERALGMSKRNVYRLLRMEQDAKAPETLAIFALVGVEAWIAIVNKLGR